MGRLGASLFAGLIGLGCIVVPARAGFAVSDPSPFIPCNYFAALPAVNNVSSSAVPLGFNIEYYSQHFNSVYVNENGNVTFGRADSDVVPFTAAGTSNGPAMIAPFYADVDTSAPGSGLVHFGNAKFTDDQGQSRNAFCVEWGDPGGKGVGRFDKHGNQQDKFQLVLVDRGDRSRNDFDAIFNYGTMQWDTGDGVNGQPGVPAGAGFAAGFFGDGQPQNFYGLIGSDSSHQFIGTSQRHGISGLSFGSTVPGRYVFNMLSGAPKRPEVSIGKASFYEGDSGALYYPFGIPVTLSEPSAAPVAVRYTITSDQHGGSIATPGVDYMAQTTPKLMQLQQSQAGLAATTGFIPITIFGDTNAEPDEKFNVTITSVDGALLAGNSTFPARITDDDTRMAPPGIHVAVADASIVQGETVSAAGGFNILPFGVSLSQPNPGPGNITVTYALQDGTAKSGVDYNMLLGSTLTFPPGAQTTPVLVGIPPNANFASAKKFQIILTGVTGAATITQPTATGTILRGP